MSTFKFPWQNDMIMTGFNLERLPANLQIATNYRDLQNNETLFYQNESANAIFIVGYGCIKLIHYSETGKIINHYSVKPGEYFAEVALFNEIYVCTAIAFGETRVLSIPKHLFLKALESDTNLSKHFTEQLARRLHHTKILLEVRGIRSARDRVLHYLRVMTPPQQKTFDLEQPLKDIATDIGLSPESLSRVLTQLQNEGILTRIKRKIIFREFY